jgi:hypothetical protein
MKLLFTIIILALKASALGNENIKDPISDFLLLPIEDRYSSASELTLVEKVLIDIDLDGQPEVFIGHRKMWQGDNDGVYFAVYKTKSLGQYERLTRPDQDIRLTFREGRSEFNFVGRVDELGVIGLLIFNPPYRDMVLSPQRIESRQFLSVSNGVLRVQELPGLDLTRPSEKKLFEKYSGQTGQQGSYSYEPLTAEKLTELGYALPDWTKLPVLGKLSAIDNRQKSKDQETRSSDRASAKIQAQNKEQPASSEVGNSSRLWFWITGIVVVLLIVWSLLKRQS